MIFSATISISPVSISLFLLDLSATLPVTVIAHSVFKSTICDFKFSSSEIIICVIPNSSLKSTNVIFPKFLIFCTHPASRTSFPTSSNRNSLQ